MRIIVFLTTAVAQLVAAFLGFFVVLLGMNGFSESDATPGFIFYIVLAFTSVLGFGAASAYTAKRLTEKTSFGRFGASAIAVICFAILGALILFIGLIAVFFLTEAIHKWK